MARAVPSEDWKWSGSDSCKAGIIPVIKGISLSSRYSGRVCTCADSSAALGNGPCLGPNLVQGSSHAPWFPSCGKDWSSSNPKDSMQINNWKTPYMNISPNYNRSCPIWKMYQSKMARIWIEHVFSPEDLSVCISSHHRASIQVWLLSWPTSFPYLPKLALEGSPQLCTGHTHGLRM